MDKGEKQLVSGSLVEKLRTEVRFRSLIFQERTKALGWRVRIIFFIFLSRKGVVSLQNFIERPRILLYAQHQDPGRRIRDPTETKPDLPVTGLRISQRRGSAVAVTGTGMLAAQSWEVRAGLNPLGACC